MPTITLYGGRMGSSLRAHWMLAELGLPYETKSVDLRAGENRTPEFLALNPMGQIPVLIIDDFVLTESMAISRYLAARFKPELNGATPEEQAKGMQWELWTMLNVQKHLLTLAMSTWTGVSDPVVEEKAKEELVKVLPILDAALSKQSYLSGEHFTTGDLNAVAGLTYAGFSGFSLTSYPNILRWMETCTSRPTFASAKGV